MEPELDGNRRSTNLTMQKVMVFTRKLLQVSSIGEEKHRENPFASTHWWSLSRDQPSPALFKLLIAALVTCYAIGSYAACQLKCDIGRGLNCEISPVRRRRPNEVAKVVGEDGHIRLRGVASMSDVRRYCQDIDPYSRKSWAVREAFKSMRSEEHHRTAALTWSALKSWQASERPLDEWYATVRR
ncbi:unnamed protein product [Cladocopium goreaui]|uniref:Uncharacterized protein n=1 Tax=Cladocopium goreaui TaxID=2562237 RepID=A0A9P1C9Z9_9DINO|nr:unnamed protein product [Cladocopium goreaui]